MSKTIYTIMEVIYDGEEIGSDLVEMPKPIMAFTEWKEAQNYLSTLGTPGRSEHSYRRVDKDDYVHIYYPTEVGLR